MANRFPIILQHHRHRHRLRLRLPGTVHPNASIFCAQLLKRRPHQSLSSYPVSRRLVFGIGVSFWAQFMSMAAKSGTTSFIASATTKGAVEQILQNVEWPEQFPFKEEDFQCFDESSDLVFYESPRFVTHIDDPAIAALTKYYKQVFPPSNTPGVALLDMCSSWVSHFPAGYKQERIVGMGLNQEELKANKSSKKSDGSSSSNAIASMPAKVWQPGVDALEEGEELQCDPSAYNSLHAFHIGWPCLSFDVVRDSLGLVRTEFPHTIYCVTGTQANGAPNSIGLFKISNISGKRRELVPTKTSNADTDMDSDSSDSDEDDELENDGPKAPVFQLRKVFHEGCVNRIRAMTQKPHICATWGDTGHVQIWDFSSHLNALAECEATVSKDTNTVSQQTPLVKFTGHKDEGYAIDWSPLVPGRLVSGDCKNSIHLWEPTSDSTWNVDNKPFVGHTASVEDLQWSPTEPFVFASSSVDTTIAIWDTRLGKSPAASIKAHNTDVNVISWNRLASCMLASGSDDGTFSIRDLRMLKEGDSVVAHFEYHKHPITSIEWSPHEASTLAVSSSDNQLTIWDLSLERDEEEEAEFKAKTQEEVHAPTDLPPQLLFVHQGQKDLKEVHWHTQIPGMLISTAADGFNILMPSNIESNLPAA